MGMALKSQQDPQLPEGAFPFKFLSPFQMRSAPLGGDSPFSSQVLEALRSAEHSLPVFRPLAIFQEISGGEASLQFCFLANYSVFLP